MQSLPGEPPADSPEVQAAVTAIVQYWGEMTRQWPWMRQASLRPIYVLAGELLAQLTHAFPALLGSNQRHWYATSVAGMPSIYVLFPEHFLEEARKRLGGSDPHLLEGKQAVTFIYLAPIAGVQQVAKTLLISTASEAPMFRAQLAHELLNCCCATDWDGRQMRAGMRLVHWSAGSALQRGGLLNDLFIDTLLIDFLPTVTSYTRGTLIDGQQGPYWRIVEAVRARIDRLAILGALFGPDADRLMLERRLNEQFKRNDAALWLDQLLGRRDWARLAEVMSTAPDPSVGLHLPTDPNDA